MHLKMHSNLNQTILKATNASDAKEVEEIQTLWSGYGKIIRVALTGGSVNTVIVKNIVFPNQTNHPRGWNTNTSHERKVKSYQVEVEWYKNYSKACDENCKVPLCYGAESRGEDQVIVLEDLDAAGFPIRKSHLSKEEVKVCLKWLANFHATFMAVKPEGLWINGSYWHLATRPDELAAMDEGDLKRSASTIDKQLNNCRYQTLIHGDAKVANFCFNENLDKVAAVDFQYVGGGCGMKDVSYLMGSCLTEVECGRHEEELLNFYFSALEMALVKKEKALEFKDLEMEWRKLYPIAWADFTRFLMGWMPAHQKINGYSKKMVNKVLATI